MTFLGAKVQLTQCGDQLRGHGHVYGRANRIQGQALALLPQVRGPVCGGVQAGGMASVANRKDEKRRTGCFERIGRVLGHRERREAFAIYAAGLLRLV